MPEGIDRYHDHQKASRKKNIDFLSLGSLVQTQGGRKMHRYRNHYRTAHQTAVNGDGRRFPRLDAAGRGEIRGSRDRSFHHSSYRLRLNNLPS